MDKISLKDILIRSFSMISGRRKPMGILFLLMSSLYVLEDVLVGDLPPDPFTWIIHGAPFMLLFAPVATLMFHHLLRVEGSPSKLIPRAFGKMAVKFSLYYVLFLIIFWAALAIAVIGSLLLVGFFVEGKVTSGALPVKILFVLLLLFNMHFVVKRVLMLPAAVDGDDSPFAISNRLIKGHLGGFVASFVMLYLPLILIPLLLEYFGQDTVEFTWGREVLNILFALFSALASMLGVSLLCSWYKELKARLSLIEKVAAANYGQCQD